MIKLMKTANIATSGLRDFQVKKYPTISCGMGISARPINWAGAYAHPTILDNLFVGVS